MSEVVAPVEVAPVTGHPDIRNAVTPSIEDVYNLLTEIYTDIKRATDLADRVAEVAPPALEAMLKNPLVAPFAKIARKAFPFA